MAATIPTLASLEAIYPETSLDTQRTRWNNLLQSFRTHYSAAPDFISRSPGRVNLIGEHIDYSLYPVVPMAVEQDVLLAIRATPCTSGSAPKIRLANLDPRFTPQEVSLDSNGSVEIDSTRLDWGNYFKAGLRGAAQRLAKLGHSKLNADLDVLATGSVPAGGGMSSSAAFVCAAALGVVRAAGLDDVGKRELVETAIVAERSVGVNAGGMDQAASVFGEKGAAL